MFLPYSSSKIEYFTKKYLQNLNEFFSQKEKEPIGSIYFQLVLLFLTYILFLAKIFQRKLELEFSNS